MHTTQSTLLRKFVGVSHFPYLHPSRCIGICSRVSMSSVVSSSTHTPMPMPMPMPTLTNIDFSRISVGTFQIKGPLCVDVVRTALGLGYRRIDTATVYKNETEVGQAMKESRIPREEIHITSKLGPSQMESSDTAYNGVRESLAKIGVDRLDSYLIHWPGRGGWRPDNPLHGYHRLQAWRGLERAKDEGLVEKIGVSNFEIRHLEELKKDWRIAPFSNQFELHPFIYSTQLPLIEWCRSHNIHVEAYSPLGSSAGIADLVSNEVIVRIGKECSQSPSNILLRWAYQHGFEILPKTKTLTRLNENAASCAKNWSLSVEQMSEIDGLEKKYGTKKYCWDPATIQ